MFRHDPRPAWHPDDRDELILSLARNRKLLHVGCTDAPFTTDKTSSGDLLHAKLRSVASDLVGVDIDEEGVRFLQRELGGRFILGDVAARDIQEQCLREEPEFIVATDVVEHVGAPAAFLGALGDIARASSAEVLITTPNAFAARNTLYAAFGVEVMHPDHLHLYSITTLSNAGERVGLVPMRIWTYGIRPGGSASRRAVDRFACVMAKRRPLLGDGLAILFGTVAP